MAIATASAKPIDVDSYYKQSTNAPGYMGTQAQLGAAQAARRGEVSTGGPLDGKDGLGGLYDAYTSAYNQRNPPIDTSAVTSFLDVAGQGAQNQYLSSILNANSAYDTESNYSNQLRGFANRAYQINNGLNDESRYRDVDLGRRNNDEDRRYITTTWSDLKNFLKQNRGTAESTIAQQRHDFTVGNLLNNRGRNLGLRQALLDRQQRDWGINTDATARNAMSSRGHDTQISYSRRGYNNDVYGTQLSYDKASNDLLSAWRVANTRYHDTLNALQNQYNVGQNTYTHGIAGVNNNASMLDSLARTYAIKAQQNALDRDQANASAAYRQAGALDQLNQAQAQALAMRFQAQLAATAQARGMTG